VLFRGQAGAKIGFMFEKELNTERPTPKSEIRGQRSEMTGKMTKHPPSLGYGAASEW
jgi:hypothetical protein